MSICEESRESRFFTVMTHISSRCSSNSEAYASELLENTEEMFSLYYMHSDTFIKLQFPDTQ